MQRHPTIKEVAAQAGVSTATVSNVLAGKETLYSAETARAVQHAVGQLGYRPNRVARSLQRRFSHTLGVVIDKPHGRLTANYYMTALLDGFLEFSAVAGYQIKLVSLLMDNSHTVLDHLDDGSVDGFALFAPPDDSPLLTWAPSVRVPVVMVGSTPPSHPFACVDFDDEGAARLIVEHLTGLGHRRIGLLAGPDAQWSARRRKQGYLIAMRNNGIEPASEWIQSCGYAAYTAEQAISTLLAIRPRLTAIACWNDEAATDTMTACQCKRIHIPRDLSVTGFDDANIASSARLQLTTIKHPISEIGNRAAESLIHQIETGERAEPPLFPGSLVIRHSTGYPKGGSPLRRSTLPTAVFA